MKYPLSKKGVPVLWAVLIVFTLQVFYLIKTQSPVTDAIAFHVVNGYAYLQTHDFRMSPATPPFVREWMALPWLLWQPVLDLGMKAWTEADSVPFGLQFFYQDNRFIAWQMLVASRIMVYWLALAVLWAVFAWTRRLYGTQAALFAIVLMAFQPLFVGYSAIVNIEIGITLFYFCTMFFLYLHWEERNSRRFPWLAAIAFGLALASKFTAVLLVPVVLGIAVWRLGFLRGVLTWIGFNVTALLVCWSTYFFEFKPLLAGIPRVEEKIEMVRGMFAKFPAFADTAVQFAQNVPMPLSSWVLGFAGIARSHRDVYLQYFMGEWRDHQVWYHYLVSFALKVTIAFLVLIVLRCVTAPFFRKTEDDKAAMPYLWGPIGILFVMTCVDSTGVGMRYLIPTLPFFAVWIAKLWRWGMDRRVLHGVLVVLAAAHIGAALYRFPYYIAYFNEFIGGPKNAYRYFRANDLEWGQGLISLGKAAREKGWADMRLALFGSYDYSFYGIQGEPVEPDEHEKPRPALYAISVFKLDHFAWTKELQPAQVIDHVIWVYDFRESGEAPPSLPPADA